jgi:hypothetical protein
VIDAIPNEELIRALLEGKTIQWQREVGDEFVDLPCRQGAMVCLALNKNPCRIKPTPKPNVVTWFSHYNNGAIYGGCNYRPDITSALSGILRIEIDHNDPANPVLVSATFEKP